MKKILLSCLAVFLLVIYGCSGNNTNKNNINEDAVDYKGNLVIQGVGPTISMEPVVDEGMLALRGDFEDHADHIFVPAGLWEDFFESANEYLPGNTVNFEGKIEFLDGAAGNHYYGVISIDKMDIVGYPDSDGIKNILDSYNYCEDDLDCTYIMGECPFGCFVAFNKKFENIPSNIIENYFDINGISCMYNCMYMNDVICENYKCTMTHNTDNDVVNTMCDPDSKSEDVMCTMIFDPVCGSDGTTYGNSCEACKSETVKSYTAGEC